MVVGAFPVAKLASLFIKQISKPIANLAKERAKSHPFFRTYICMPPAQFYNWCEVKTKMWVLNMGKPVNIPVLSESMAIELGANLLGEGIIFLIAAGVLLAEYSRQIRKEAAKENARIGEIATIQNSIQELRHTVEVQKVHIEELSLTLREIENKFGIKGRTHKLADKSSSSSPPPSASIIRSNKNEIETKEPNKSLKDSSVIHEALTYIEKDLFSRNDNEIKLGLLTKGLDYLYYNSFLIS